MWCSCVVFFKQKTAYEMRISDWSSDVCSSDLPLARTWRPWPRLAPCLCGTRRIHDAPSLASVECMGDERHEPNTQPFCCVIGREGTPSRNTQPWGGTRTTASRSRTNWPRRSPAPGAHSPTTTSSANRSEEQTHELQSLLRISYADLCSKYKHT